MSTGGRGGPGGRAPSICARPAKRRGPTLAGPYRFPTRPCFTCDPGVDLSMLCIDCGEAIQRTRMVRGGSHHTRMCSSVSTVRTLRASGPHRLVHGGVHAHLHRQRPHRVLMPHVEHKPERLARVKQDVGYRPKRDSRLRSNTRGIRATRRAGNSARCASQGSRRERPRRESALQSGTPQSASTLLREANASKPVSRTAKSACAAGSAAHRGPR